MSVLLPRTTNDGKDYLACFARNGSFSCNSRLLRIDVTNGDVEGIAGRAWKDGGALARGVYKTPLDDDAMDADKERYEKIMFVDSSYWEADGHSRASRFVLAVCLSDNAGRKCGVLTVDAADASNILGYTEDGEGVVLDGPLDASDLTPKSGTLREQKKLSTQRINHLVDYCKKLERSLELLFRSVNHNDAA